MVARHVARVSRKLLEAAAFSSVSASACVTLAATAERWWTKKERVEVRAVPYTVPSVAPCVCRCAPPPEETAGASHLELTDRQTVRRP